MLPESDHHTTQETARFRLWKENSHWCGGGASAWALLVMLHLILSGICPCSVTTEHGSDGSFNSVRAMTVSTTLILSGRTSDGAHDRQVFLRFLDAR